MPKKIIFVIGIAVLVSLIGASFLVSAQQIGDKLSRVMKLRLGLDSDIYRVIETEYQGEKLVFIAILGDEKAQSSSLGTDIKSGLREYREKTPVAISVLSQNKEARFHPYALRITQEGESFRPKNLIGITNEFKQGAMPTKVPIEGEVFWGGKGIITLGVDFDLSLPFEIKYGTKSVRFPGKSVSEPEAREFTDEKPETEPAKPDAFKGSSQENSTQKPENPGRNRAPVRNSGRGQGLALLAQLGTLLAITLSFL